MKGRLLIIEDDQALGQLLQMHFEDHGYTVDLAVSCGEAMRCMCASEPRLVLLDQRLPDGSGIDMLATLRQAEPELPVIMMTGVHDLELAVLAIKRGAYDFIHKPLRVEELDHVITRALEHRRLAEQVAVLRTGAEELAALGDMIGKSRVMVQVSKEIALASESDASVLITGESGTGKELVARAIHAHSGRRGLFLAVNCAAIVDPLLESELFGHEKGAFTGAVARKAGRFELASDGTLFLDEIGELAPRLQAKLLRVLQERTFERLGGTQTLVSNARILAATNRDLKRAVEAGSFREDLLYRLDVVHIHVPPLRERREDIPLLVGGLLARISAAVHKPRMSVTEDAMTQLAAYPWPGNVRELENVLTQAVVRARGPILDRDSMRLPRDAAMAASIGAAQALPALQTLEVVEAAHVRRVLDHTRGHKGKACAILGISRPALDRKIRKYGLVAGGP